MQLDILFFIFLGLASLMLVLALLLQLFPAPKPSSFYGYKTDRSRRSRKNWKYAQKQFPLLFMRMGFYYILAALAWLYLPSNSITFGLVLLGLVTVLGFAAEVNRTENRLKRYSKEKH